MKNKKMYLTLFTIIMILFSYSIVFADAIDYGNLCSSYDDGIGKAARLLGYAIEVVKWVIPLIIIIFGMIDFGKAVLSSDDKAINKATSTLIRRIIAGVAIYFIPILLLAILNAVDITDGIEETTRFSACTKCILEASTYCP